jgi:hypothetical protein
MWQDPKLQGNNLAMGQKWNEIKRTTEKEWNAEKQRQATIESGKESIKQERLKSNKQKSNNVKK